MKRCHREQIELRLHGWGGRRERAGRKPGARPRVRHLSRQRVVEPHPCHVTLKVRQDVPSLRSVRLVRELERSFSNGCERGSFRLVHYSIQDDHAHLIAEAKDAVALGRGVKAVGARLARVVNRVFRRRGPVLADRYHLQVLKTPSQVRNALRYVLLNARKHAKRVRRARGLDPASSGRWFDGWRRSLEPVPKTGSPPVARARSWLLTKGWRHRGLIDPDEVPGPRR